MNSLSILNGTFLAEQITERLRDPRGLRKAGAAGAGPRGVGVGPQRLAGRGLGPRGIVRRVSNKLKAKFHGLQ